MQIGLALGRGLATRNLGLPSALADVHRRAEFISRIDRPLLIDGDGVPQWTEMGRHLRDIATESADVMPEVGDPLDRVAIALRLWSGCLNAAKTIAEDTRSGPNTRQGRRDSFEAIDAVSATDELYRAGVEAAPAFKAARGDPFSFDGVPEESSVRRYQFD